MEFLSKFFKKHKKEMTEAELLVKANAFISKLEKLITDDDNLNEAVIEVTGESHADIHPAINFGAPLHERFANLVLTLIYQLGIANGEKPVKINYKDLLQSVKIITHDDATTIGQFINVVVQDERKDLILFTYELKDVSAVSTIIGLLYEFTIDPRTILLIDMAGDFCIRRSSLLSVPFLNRNDEIRRIEGILSKFYKKQPGVKCSSWGEEVIAHGFMLANKFWRSV